MESIRTRLEKLTPEDQNEMIEVAVNGYLTRLRRLQVDVMRFDTFSEDAAILATKVPSDTLYEQIRRCHRAIKFLQALREDLPFIDIRE